MSPTMLDIVAGVSLHFFVFRHGEWDFTLPVLTVNLIGVSALLVATGAVLLKSQLDVFWAWLSAISLHATRIAGSLFMSILIYRWRFHCLHRFPGPFGSRFSTAYIMWKSAKSKNAFEMVAEYHRKYGDFVRIGECDGLLQTLSHRRRPCIRSG